MDKDVKRKITVYILFAASLFFNVVFILFFVAAALGKTASLSFRNMGDTYLTAACVVSMPEQRADLVFGPVEFTLIHGEKAALQLTAYLDGKQLNMAPDPLYDRSVIAVEKTGYGLLIEALSPGEAVFQTITSEGIRDLARVTVTAAKASYPPHAGGQQVEAD